MPGALGFWLGRAKRDAKLVAWILAACAALGTAYALLTPPVYSAKAVVTPKESRKQPSLSGALAGLGGMGGFGALQLGADKADITRLGIIAGGWELARDVIEKNRLLPALFPEAWDAGASRWKSADPADTPNLRKGVDKLMSETVRLESDLADNTLEISSHIYDPDLAVRVVQLYLKALEEKLRQNVIVESRANQKYLGDQLEKTMDPSVREKIQNMLAYEMEREMLVGNSAVDVLIGPLKPLEREKPQRKKIVLLCLITGMFLSGTLVYWRGSAGAASA